MILTTGEAVGILGMFGSSGKKDYTLIVILFSFFKMSSETFLKLFKIASCGILKTRYFLNVDYHMELFRCVFLEGLIELYKELYNDQ